jgi:peroxiredoxin Q/BCP
MNRSIFLVVAALILCSGSFSMEIGEHIPTIEAVNQDAEIVNFGGFGEKGYLLVFFYPKAETPGCIKHVCSVRDAFSELSDEGVKVLGVSADSVAAQKHFHENRSLPYSLIADEAGKVVAAFGVPTNESGRAKRQAFLFKDGSLVWKDETASTETQAADVLEAIKSAK